MRVLLVSTNRENLPDPVAPIGAAYVAAALKRAGHEVKFLDLQFAVDVPVALKDAWRTFRPQAVGLSIRNVDNIAFPYSVSYMPEAVSAVKVLKQMGAKLIVAGGAGFSLMPAEVMRELDINLGVAGEGEEAFPELLRRIEGGLAVDALPGLVYRRLGEIKANPPSGIEDLDAVEPDRSIIENTLYMTEGGSGNLQTKRGCAFNCSYCVSPLSDGAGLRLRKPAKAAAEFETAARNFGLKHIFVVDNVFNHPVDHAKQFCRELIARKVDAGWSCSVNPAFVDEELAGLMVKAGCRGAEFGTDSTADTVLGALGKNFRAAQVAEASRICTGAGLPFCHSLLIGAPGEDFDTVRRTFDDMDSMRPNAIIAMLGIRVYPGTEMERRARAEGVIGDGPAGLKPVFYFQPGIDMEGISEFLRQYGRDHANFIMPGIHLRMTDKIRQTLRGYGFLGPLWEYLRA